MYLFVTNVFIFKIKSQLTTWILVLKRKTIDFPDHKYKVGLVSNEIV